MNMNLNYSGINDIIQHITDNDNFLIIIHDKPDGDAVGSATALALFIMALEKKCTVLSPSEIPERLIFIKNDNVTYAEGAQSIDKLKYDSVITVDVASPELISPVLPLLTKPIDLIIDHHRVNTINGNYKYIDSGAAAAGEIIFNIVSMYCSVMNNNLFDVNMCSALFAAISSDTGCFKYGNTTSQSHSIAAHLLSTGINAEEINRLLFDTKTEKQIKTEQLGYQKLNLYYGGKLAVIDIDIADLEAIGATEADTETISQLARMIAGVQIGVMMREKTYPDGKTGYKFSVRANADTDVSELCAQFGGGGHKKAAGCTIYDTKESALNLFINESKAYLI